jgi:hypothetical protein
MAHLGNLKYCAVLFLVVGAASAGAVKPLSVNSLVDTRPCVAREAKLPAYLHASRHGSSITDGPGTNTKALPVTFAATDPKERETLLSYVYRPQAYLHNSFRAEFIGMVRCEAGGPVFEIRGLRQVEIRPVRDARVSPNNSSKPTPLRGAA